MFGMLGRKVSAAARAARAARGARNTAEIVSYTNAPGIYGVRTPGRFFGFGRGATQTYYAEPAFEVGPTKVPAAAVSQLAQAERAERAAMAAAARAGKSSGRQGMSMKRKALYGGIGVVGTSAAVMGLRGKSSGGTGQITSQNQRTQLPNEPMMY